MQRNSSFDGQPVLTLKLGLRARAARDLVAVLPLRWDVLTPLLAGWEHAATLEPGDEMVAELPELRLFAPAEGASVDPALILQPPPHASLPMRTIACFSTAGFVPQKTLGGEGDAVRLIRPQVLMVPSQAGLPHWVIRAYPESSVLDATSVPPWMWYAAALLIAPDDEVRRLFARLAALEPGIAAQLLKNGVRFDSSGSTQRPLPPPRRLEPFLADREDIADLLSSPDAALREAVLRALGRLSRSEAP
jgi:hypothetical protein